MEKYNENYNENNNKKKQNQIIQQPVIYSEDIYDITKYSDNELFDILDLVKPTDRELEAKIIIMIKRYSETSGEESRKNTIFFQSIYDHFFENGGEDEEDGEEEENGENEKNEKESNNKKIKEGFDSMKMTTSKIMQPTTPSTTISTDLIETTKTPNKNSLDYVKSLDYTPGQLNPVLKETIKRVISIDSQYRDKTKLNSMSTNFTFNLSESIPNVVSLKLYSIQIPYTWYTISSIFGGNFFYIKGNTDGINNGFYDYKIEIAPGNYSIPDLINNINYSIEANLYPLQDIDFGTTRITYSTQDMKATIIVDIKTIYNQTHYYIDFQNGQLSSGEDNIPYTETFDSSSTSLSNFLGFVYNKNTRSIGNYTDFNTAQNIIPTQYYQPNYVFSSVLYGATFENGTFFDLNGTNGIFNIYYFYDVSGLTEYDATWFSDPLNAQYIKTQKMISIYDISNNIASGRSFNRTNYISFVNNAIKSVPEFIDSGFITVPANELYPKYVVGGERGQTRFRMTIKWDRTKIINLKNMKTAVIFPDDSQIWIGTGNESSAFNFKNRVNVLENISAEIPNPDDPFIANQPVSITLKCIKPLYDIPLNDYIINYPSGLGNYLNNMDMNIPSILATINTGYSDAVNMYPPNELFTYPTDNPFCTIDENGNMNMKFSINKIFNEHQYSIDFSQSIFYQTDGSSIQSLGFPDGLLGSGLVGPYAPVQGFGDISLYPDSTLSAYQELYAGQAYIPQIYDISLASYSYTIPVQQSYKITNTNNRIKITPKYGYGYGNENESPYYVYIGYDTSSNANKLGRQIDMSGNEPIFPDDLSKNSWVNFTNDNSDNGIYPYTFSTLANQPKWYRDPSGSIIYNSLPELLNAINYAFLNKAPIIDTSTNIITNITTQKTYPPTIINLPYIDSSGISIPISIPINFLSKSKVSQYTTSGISTISLDIKINNALTYKDYKVIFTDISYNSWTENLYFDSSYVLSSYPNSNIIDIQEAKIIASHPPTGNSNDPSNNTITLYPTNNIFYIKPLYNAEGGVYIQNSTKNNITITIPATSSGTIYSRYTLLNAINTQFANNPLTIGSKIFFGENDGLVYIYLNINKVFTTNDFKLVFYDESFNYNSDCKLSGSSNLNLRNTYIDSTLGWMLGFRDLQIYSLSQSNMTVVNATTSYYSTYINTKFSYDQNTNIASITGDTTICIFLFSYFMIIMDDFTQNHLNDGLITITKRETDIPLPSYANRAVQECDADGNNIVTGIKGLGSTSYQNNAITQNSIYSANQLLDLKNQRTNNNYGTVSSGISVNDIFGIIPIKTGTAGTPYIEFGGSLQNQERTYFGPVNLRRMKIQLVNDRGNIVDLNGAEWAFSLICEQLYTSNKLAK